MNPSRLIKATLPVFLFTALNLDVGAATPKSGLILDETWTSSGSPYVMEGDIRVASLTIEPGVDVLFPSNTLFEIEGRIIAVGTPAQPIVFERTEGATGWRGIFFNFTGDDSVLLYCTITGAIEGALRTISGSPVISQCKFINNSVPGQGGAIRVQRSTVSLTNCLFLNNTAGSEGGAIFADGSQIRMRDCTVISNGCLYGGGGIHLARSPAAFQNTLISANVSTSSYGGGVYASEEAVSFQRVGFHGNLSLHGGGAFVRTLNHGVFVDNCDFEGNQAGGDAGGLYLDNSQATLRNSRFNGNSCANHGGGLFLSGGAVKMTNCLMWNNNLFRGADCVFASAPSFIVNCSIAYNGSIGIWVNTAGIELLNSVVFFNAEQIRGTLSASYSGVQGGYAGLSNINQNPIFQSRSNLMLVSGSPCIDRGDTNAIYNDTCFPPSRGTIRNDMGAYGGPGACDWITGDEPVILVQPKSQTSCLGQDVTLWVRVVGPEPLGYQWVFNGTNLLTGQTSSNLVLAALESMQGGSYSVLVTNRFGSVLSESAVLQVFDACVDIRLYAGLSITGMVGRTYTLSYTTDVADTNSWIRAATNTFAEPSWFYLDRETPFQPRRFYRVDLVR